MNEYIDHANVLSRTHFFCVVFKWRKVHSQFFSLIKMNGSGAGVRKMREIGATNDNSIHMGHAPKCIWKIILIKTAIARGTTGTRRRPRGRRNRNRLTSKSRNERIHYFWNGIHATRTKNLCFQIGSRANKSPHWMPVFSNWLSTFSSLSLSLSLVGGSVGRWVCLFCKIEKEGKNNKKNCHKHFNRTLSKCWLFLLFLLIENARPHD